MVLTSRIERQRKEQIVQVSDLCRQKLLGYAESFQELARSFDDKFVADSKDRQSVLEQKRIWENRKTICDNLSEVAHIMEKVAEEEFRYLPIENRYERAINKILREEEIYADNLCYLPCENGQQAVGMTLWTTRRGGIPALEIADLLSVVLHKQMQISAVSPCLVDEKNRSFIFVEEANYIALTGFARVVRENEPVSGDNYAILESEKGKMTVLLSDGTGSGEKANRDSDKVLDLMEKMLEAGYSIKTALNLINSALYVKEEDNNHPTIDVCNLDLYQGKCEFYKVGGAVSFLKRGGQRPPLSLLYSVNKTHYHRISLFCRRDPGIDIHINVIHRILGTGGVQSIKTAQDIFIHSILFEKFSNLFSAEMFMQFILFHTENQIIHLTAHNTYASSGNVIFPVFCSSSYMLYNVRGLKCHSLVSSSSSRAYTREE